VNVRGQIIFWSVLVIFLVSFPFVMPTYYLHIGNMILVHILLAISVGLVLGYLGELSFGHSAFYGLGAYFSSYVTLNFGWSFWISLPSAVVFTMIIGLGVGLLSFRTKGHYFALVTMGMGQIFFLFAHNLEHITGGGAGMRGIQPPDPISLGFITLSFESKLSMYFLILIVVSIVILLTYLLIHSRYGRGFITIKEDAILSEFTGLPTLKYKLLNFTFSAGIAGIAGGLAAHYLLFVSPDYLSLEQSVDMLLMVIVGGVGTILGPILGGSIVTVLLQLLNSVNEYKMLVYGLLLIALIIYMPKGLVGLFNNRKKRLKMKKSLSTKKSEEFM
jgi:branched-chain amino acid transport system permease protein